MSPSSGCFPISPLSRKQPPLGAGDLGRGDPQGTWAWGRAVVGGSGGQGTVLGKEECGPGLQERWGLERAKIRQSIWRGEKREAPAFQMFLTICFLIEVLLICDIVLVSIVQHVMELYMYTHMDVRYVC